MYRQLETFGASGWTRLATGGELDEPRPRHAESVLAVLDRARVGLHSDAQAEWFERLDEELPNIESALEWSLRTPESPGRVVAVVQRLRHYRLAGGVRPPAGLRWR